jgi:tRNA splicing ligase
MVKTIREKYYHMQARKIQRNWRRYWKQLEAERKAEWKKYKKMHRLEGSTNDDTVSGAEDGDEGSMTDDGSSAVSVLGLGVKKHGTLATLWKPISSFTDSLGRVGKYFKELQDIDILGSSEQKRFENSVLKYQIKSILQGFFFVLCFYFVYVVFPCLFLLVLLFCRGYY